MVSEDSPGRGCVRSSDISSYAANFYECPVRVGGHSGTERDPYGGSESGAALITPRLRPEGPMRGTKFKGDSSLTPSSRLSRAARLARRQPRPAGLEGPTRLNSHLVHSGIEQVIPGGGVVDTKDLLDFQDIDSAGGRKRRRTVRNEWLSEWENFYGTGADSTSRSGERATPVTGVNRTPDQSCSSSLTAGEPSQGGSDESLFEDFQNIEA